MKNALIIGTGGREHALGWKISKVKRKENFHASGNGGTNNNRYCQTKLKDLLNFAKHKKCFTIRGPEIPVIRIVD